VRYDTLGCEGRARIDLENESVQRTALGGNSSSWETNVERRNAPILERKKCRKDHANRRGGESHRGDLRKASHRGGVRERRGSNKPQTGKSKDRERKKKKSLWLRAGGKGCAFVVHGTAGVRKHPALLRKKGPARDVRCGENFSLQNDGSTTGSSKGEKKTNSPPIARKRKKMVR